jgi:hypothetical protein
MVGLKIEDKKFIPSRDAAKISGYDSDYVGQLCRLGKLECKRVGRAWFVNEDSLLKHCASKGNEKPFQVEEISKETPAQENPSNGEVYNFSEFDRNNKPLLKKTVVSTEDSNVLKTAEKTIEIRESLVVSGKTENGGVVSSTEKTSTLNNLGNGIHLPNFSEIKFSQIISIPSKDFFHKTISILVAFVIVFGAYAFRDSGYIDDGVSLFSKGISSVKTLVVEISNIDSNDIKQFAFNANKSLNTYFGEKTKSAKNTSSKILTSAVLKLRDITSTVSFAVSDFKNHPINFTKDSSETFFRGTVLSFKELKESAEDIAVGSGKTFSKVEGLAVSIFRSVGDSLYAGVVEVSNDPFISVKTLARNFNIEVNSLFRSGIKIVSSLWEPNINPEIVLKVPPRKTLSQNVPTSVIVEGPRTIVRTVTENITYKGISREEVEQMVSALNGTLRQEIYKLTGVTAGNSVYINNVYNAVAQTNRIDQLHGVNFNNGVINNSTINGGSISGATLSGSSFSDSLSIGGNLTVSGTGTSTFAGDSSFDGGVLYIDSVNNRVGVATTTPQFTFDVDGIINASALYVNGAPYIGSQWTSTSSDIYFDSGKVGIGTSSPSELLSVNGAIYIASSTPAVGASRLYNNQGDLYWNGNLIAGGAVGNWTGADGNVYRTSGNVGIGTTSPFATLSVAGIGSFDDYVRASYFTATSTTATSTFAGGLSVASSTFNILNHNGYVGIGTSTPSSKLALSGGNFTHTASGNPILAGTYNTSGNAYGVYVSGKYAYVADYTPGLQIIDISNPVSPILVGTYDTSGSAVGVHVSGKYAYVADSTSGLQIIDISNPTSPTLTGTYNTSGLAFWVYVSGKYAYVADHDAGLRIIDISNPASPTLTGTYNTSGNGAYGVYVSGKYAYVADHDAGLQIINISNPASPTLTGTYNTDGNAYGVYVSGKYAYVADDTNGGLKIIDISNPASPTLTGTYNTSGGYARSVYVSGKYAYVGDLYDGLQIIDISNPASPTLTGTYNTSDMALTVYVSGKYAYVADGSSGLQIIDINGIETPSLYAGNIATNGLTVTENGDFGNNLFVRNGLNVGAGGIFTDGILSVAGTLSSYFGGNVGIGTTSPYAKLSVVGQVVGEYFTATSTTATSTFGGVLSVGSTTPAGNALFSVGTSTQNLFVDKRSGNVGIGTSTPNSKLALAGGNFTHTASGNPTLAGTYNTTGTSYKSYISGKYAYVADGTSGLQIIDVSNPSSPTLTGTFSDSSYVFDMNVSGNYAYTVGGHSSIGIVNISNPKTPILLGYYLVDPLEQLISIYVSGKYAYVVGIMGGLYVVDISDVTKPKLVGTSPLAEFAYGVYVSGKYAYVAQTSSGLRIIDISNPSSPVYVGDYNTSGTAYEVYVSGKYAYVADGTSGLHIIDISNPSSPILVGTYNTSGEAWGVNVFGKYAYVADGASGLHVIDISNPASPSLVGTYNTSGEAIGIHLSGKYAYVADGPSGLQIIDINGIETPSLYAGNIATNGLTVTEDADFGNNLFVRNGLNVGGGGIFTDGPLSVGGTTSPSYFAGKVGIGTTSPYSKLSVWGSGTGTNRLFELTNSASTTLASFLENGTGYFLGNIGIGTTSPYAKLSVVGQVVGEYFTATSTTATSTFPNLSLTNLLFGSDYLTDITGSGLSVSNGALVVSGFASTTFANMLAGFDSSGNLTSTSSPQVAYINATSTTATSTFAGNIGLSQTATTTANPIGIITMGGIPFVHAFKGESNTGDNVFIGKNSGNFTMGGATAIYGSQNTAVGVSTLKSNTTGYMNTALGWNALTSNTSGVGNTAVGFGALDSVSSGLNYNTAIGLSALTALGNSSGANNTALGVNSLVAMTSGSNNLALGFGAGTSLASGSNNILIGYNVNSTSTTASNQLNIGNVIYGTGMNSTASASHVPTANSLIGISTTSPFAKLSIHANDGEINTYLLAIASSTASATTTHFVVTNSGNIGIGTTSPYAKLSVVGQVVGEYFTATSTTATSTFPNLSLTRMLFGSDYLTDITGSGLSISNGALVVSGFASTTFANMLAGFDSSGNLTSTSSPQVAYINATSTTATSTFAGGMSVAGSSGLTVLQNGNVGINTTSPKNKLAISWTGGDTSIPALGVNGGGQMGVFGSNGNYGLLVGVLNTGNVFQQAQRVDGTATAYHLLLQPSGGRVGIGTTTPLSTISISGGMSVGANYNYAAPTNGAIIEGNVGIGSSSPNTKLVVSGTQGVATIESTTANQSSELKLSSYVTGNNVSMGNIGFYNTSVSSKLAEISGYQGASTAQTYLTFTTRSGGVNSEKMRIGDSGNIGIGTTSPYAKLSVVGEVVAEYFTATSTTATSTFGGVLSVGSTTPAGNALFSVGTSTQNLFVDKNTGNVGIGTSSPSGKFAIQTSATKGIFTSGDNLAFSTGAGIFWNANQTGLTSTAGTALQFYTNGANVLTAVRPGGSNVSLYNPNATGNMFMYGGNGAGSALYLGATSENSYLTVPSNKTFTIGSTTSYAKLAVYGNAGETNSILFAVASSTDTATTTHFVVLNNGYVGIGKSNPTTNLDVTGSASISSLLNAQTVQSSSGTFRSGNGGAVAMNFNVYGRPTMLTISTDDKVGIGTSSPYAKLSIVGQVVGEYFTATSTTATSTFPNLSTTNLSVSGNLYDSANSQGTNGYVLQTTGTGVSWVATSSLGISGVSTYLGLTDTQSSFTANRIIHTNSAGNALTDTDGFVFTGTNFGIGTTSPQSKFTLSGGNFTHVASGTPTLKGSVDTTDSAQDVYVSGKYAYVADSLSGLHIIDISNPGAPVLISSYSTGDVTYGVRVSGKYAYLADASSGLRIIDISNPNSPSLVGTYDTAGNALKVYVSGKYAYVADYTSGLTIIDISDPTSPSYVGNYNTSGGAYDVYVSGKYAYVADGTPGMHIIDISTPTNPTLVGTYNTSGSALGIYVSGKYAYVADDTNGLQVVNVSNPASPSAVGSYDTTDSAKKVFISGKYAYVADDVGGIHIIDISDPASPTLVGTYDSTGVAYSVFVSGKYAYFTDDTEGLKILDINGVETPSMYAGNIETNVLNVTENIDVGNSLFVRNGLNVGIGGIKMDGSLSVSGTTTPSYFAGNLGIGTTSPYAKLSVVGEIVSEYFTATSTTATSTFAGGMSVAGSSGLTVLQNGNIGVGTVSPTVKLQIVGNEMIHTSAGTGNATFHGMPGTAGSWVFQNGRQNSDIVFNQNVGGVVGTRVLTLRGSDGNVGIGTTSPYANLSIGGRAGQTTDLFAISSSTASFATTTAFKVASDGTVSAHTILPWGNMKQDLGSAANKYSYVYSSVFSGIGNTLLITTGGGDSIKFCANNCSGTNQMYLVSGSSGGGLSIGTTTATNYAKLMVRGNGATSATQAVEIYNTASTTLMRMLDDGTTYFNGNVGIGTTSPYAKLSVVGQTVSEYFTATSTVATSTIAGGLNMGSGNFVYDYSTGVTSINSLETGNLNFEADAGVVSWVDLPISSALAGTPQSYTAQIGNQAVMTVYGESDGAGASKNLRVGIGTTTPWARLSVSGTTTSATSNAFVVSDVASTTRFVIQDAGNVGVGTTTPWGLLSVNPNGITGPSFAIGSSTKTDFIVTNDGKIGFGTSSPFAKLSISAGTGGTAPWYTPDFVMQGPSAGFYLQNTGSGGGFGAVGVGQTSGNFIFSFANTKTITMQSTDGVTFNQRFTIDGATGNVGVSSTTPWRTLSVNGTVSMAGLTASTGAGSICLSANNELVYNAGSDACLPSLRETKHDIEDLTIDSLSILRSIDPVSFVYNDGDGKVRYGFIAEDASSIDPRLATYNEKGEISGIDDRALIAVSIKAIKEMDIKLADIEARMASSTPSVGNVNESGIISSILSFFEGLGMKISNGLAQFKKVVVEAFTVGSASQPAGITLYDEETKEPYCFKMKGGMATTTPGICLEVGSTQSTNNTSEVGTTTSAIILPTITLMGNNPANVPLGASYVDLGATGVDKDGNSLMADLISNNVDTSKVGEYEVVWSVHDGALNYATSSRTVIIFDPYAPVETATTTPVVIPIENATSTTPVIIPVSTTTSSVIPTEISTTTPIVTGTATSTDNN